MFFLSLGGVRGVRVVLVFFKGRVGGEFLGIREGGGFNEVGKGCSGFLY